MAAPSSHHALKVLDQIRVSPPPGTVSAASLPLTFFDVLWLYSGPVERVFFYRLPRSAAHFIDSVLPDLKSSLSLALRHFYPLAGRLRLSPDTVEQLEIHYTDGDSVALTVAECNHDFDELSGDQVRDLAKLLYLVPDLPEDSGGTRPLLALQATVFPGHGIAIGVAIHHVACDGASSMHFVKSWAAACRSGGSASLVEPPPVFDRTAITDPRGLYARYLNDWKRNKADQPEHRAGVVLGSFTLAREHVEKLKQRVLAAKPREEGEAPFHLSTFVLACAYVWSCIARARPCTGGGDAYLVFAADCRARLSPPLPPAYFGNCIGGCFVSAAIDSLGTEDGYVVASERIGRAIRRLEEDGVLNGADKWILGHEMGAKQPELLMSIAGSPKLRVYGTDFGWGAPVKVDVISIGRTGAVSLAESRDGDGGVEIGLALPEPEMEKFRAQFGNGIELV